MFCYFFKNLYQFLYIFYSIYIFIAVVATTGGQSWTPRCEDPWTAGQWREALQAMAGAYLGRDPTMVR